MNYQWCCCLTLAGQTTLDWFALISYFLFLLFHWHYHYHNCWYHYNFVNYIIIWSIVLSMASFFGSTNQSNLWQEMNNEAKVDIKNHTNISADCFSISKTKTPKALLLIKCISEDSFSSISADKHADGGICVIFGSFYSLVIHCTQVILLWVLFFLGQIHLNIYNNNYKMTSIQQVVEMNAG